MGELETSGINGVRTIEPELLEQELRSGRRIVLLDVRTHDEFKSGHIEGSRCIPIHQLRGRRAELRGCESLPIVVVSRHGVRAHAAAIALALGGFTDVQSLEGGMLHWNEMGFATERCSSISIPPAAPCDPRGT
jgi:rhodanese-related sulfurtransferase